MIKLAGASLVMAIAPWTTGALADDATPPSYAETTLTGDWNGYRSWLRDQGVTLTISQTSDALGNVSGGVRRGLAYDGLFELQGDFDLGRLAGWTGGTSTFLVMRSKVRACPKTSAIF